MLQRYVLIANAIISGLLGLGLIFAANTVLGIYGGMSMEPATDRLLGSALVGIAVLNFLASGVEGIEARRPVLVANFVYNVLAVLVLLPSLMGANAAVWSTIVVAVIFAIAFGYLAVGAYRSVATEPRSIAG